MPQELDTTQNPLRVATPADGTAETAGAGIDQYAILKIDSTGRFVMLAAGDAGNLMVGIALTSAAAAGDAVQVLEMYGVKGIMLSDGTATITRGQLVSPSATVAGRVFQNADDPVATALTTVAATVGVQVQVL